MASPGSASGSKRNSSEMEHSQRVPEAEPVQPQVKLKDRQKFFEEAFQQDMEHYLSTGYLQIAERRGSMSSMEVNVDMLEQMDLMDMSDHEALDVFLNSGGEDNSVASPMLGPDVESFTSEITLQVPTQADLRHKLASLSSTCTDSASQDTEAGEEEEYNDDDDDEDDEREQAANRGSLLIQPDLEEVEEDARLLEREQNRPIKNSESSSSS
ncbi:dystrobrevin binding protein 1b isoform X2 [Rhinichthys klamathensis goyatoka]|uniref:dystrobrevin binding protein 1b isoform X2 n=1 Tax=Rhinichthys klamathensis goyatoka TaxID=3034132 RepID=UPI0024B546BE|nr:dystrobrevin binding protein 1b isoform X2 [Rhinichthys klamathensis goyatoka]